MKKYAILLLSLFVLTTCESDDPIQFELSTQVNPPDGGIISPSSGTFDEGEEITLKATPSDEYVFKNWSDDASGDENPMKAVMTDDMFVTANFVKRTYPLTIEIKGEGTVKEEIVQGKSTTDYPSGTTVQLTAIPEDGWKFVKWEENPMSFAEENPMTIKITGPTTWVVTFEQITHPLTVEIVGQGSVKEEVVGAKSTNDYPTGTTVQLTAIPDDIWEFTRWEGDYEGTENPIEIKMNEPKSVTAVFNLPDLEKTYVPDDNFEQALIDLGLDDVLDDYVVTKDIAEIEELDISGKNISDLTGLKDFTSLIVLDCSNNNISSINPHLGSSFGHGFEIGTIILSDNKITSLDVSDLHFLFMLDARNNLLDCIQVSEDHIDCVNTNNCLVPMTVKTDEGVTISTNCSTSEDQLTYVPDDNFEQAFIDLGLDDILDDYVLKINILNVSALDISNRNISDVTGLEDFEGLIFLIANDNNISSIPLDFGIKWGPYPPSPWAGNLDLSNNNLSELNISKLNFFRTLDVRNNPLTCIVANENQLSYFEDSVENFLMDEGVILSLDCEN